MLVEMIAERKKFFAAQRAAEQRSKPPTKTQIRNRMCTYLKNMGGYKHNQLKGRSYEEIQKLFDKAYKQSLESDKSKKQKIDEHVEAEKDDDQEEAEMKKHIEIVKDDEVAIDVIPLATKPPMIVEYKIVKEGKFGYFQLIRADGSSKRYLSMIKMLQNIDREDLETLWKLVKAKHGNTRPEEDYERVLWGDLKVMFEPDIKSEKICITYANVNNTNNINTVSLTVNAADIENNVTDENIVYGCDDEPNMPNLEEIVYSDDDEGVDAKADMTNLDTNIFVSPTLTTRIHKDHPLEQIIGDIHSAPQTRRMTKNVTKHVEPKKVIQALQDLSWIEVMQEELLQFKLQHVWTLMDLPHGKRAIGTKWVYRNKKDERGIVIRNKARIEAIRLFLAYASFKDFVVYQMDVKSAFLYGKIEEEVYVCQPLGFEDPEFPDRVYKVEKALYGLHQAHSAWYETLSTYLLDNRFQRGQIDKSLFIKRVKGLQVTVKIASTPMDTSNPLLKDAEAKDVVVHLYRSMIGSLMYLTASRPDIMFVVCACARFQVTHKVSHLHAVKRIFRYLKGNPQHEVLWIQNQMLDYGYNFMNTKIFIDNESTICIVKNPVFHSKTKHIEIRHHFIRDSYEKRLIQVIKIHTDHNVADLLTKAFDVSRFQYLIAIDESVIKEWEDRMERAATTASSLEVEQDSGNINRTQSMATLNESFPQGTDSYSGPKCQDTILGGAEAQIRFEVASKQSNDPPLLRVNTLGSREDNMKLKELMEFCKLKLTAAINAARLNLLLLVQVNAVEGDNGIICLAKNQKFNFSKLIFDGMLRNLDPNSKKFLMYPRFLQLFLNNQIENLTPTFNDEYATPSHTKKVFANMRRQGKDFSGTVTPLFATMLIQPQADVGEGSGQPTEPQHTPTTASPSNIEPIPIIASSSQPQKTHKRRKTKRPTEISQSSGHITLVADETVHEEKGDNIERAATTTVSLDAEQDSGSGPRRQDTILGDRPAQTRFERLSKQSNDPPLSGVNTPGSGEDRLKIMELMEICTKLSDRVLALENVKTAQDLEITSLKNRVKKLEKKRKARTPQLKRRLFKVRIESSADKSLGDQEDVLIKYNA
ncbi:putative ribonuclease H-like domain-containing protein [Tanacetum coccineum]